MILEGLLQAPWGHDKRCVCTAFAITDLALLLRGPSLYVRI